MLRLLWAEQTAQHQEQFVINIMRDLADLDNSATKAAREKKIPEDFKNFLASLIEYVRTMMRSSFSPDYDKVQQRTNFIRALLNNESMRMSDQLKTLTESNIEKFQGKISSRFYNLLVQRRTFVQSVIYMNENNFDNSTQDTAKRNFVRDLLDYLNLRREEGTHVTSKIVNFFTPVDLYMRESDIYDLLNAIVSNDIEKQRIALAEGKIKKYQGWFSERLYKHLMIYRGEFEKLNRVHRQLVITN